MHTKYNVGWAMQYKHRISVHRKCTAAYAALHTNLEPYMATTLNGQKEIKKLK